MKSNEQEILRFRSRPFLADSTLVLAFSGWMDGGDVSTGTVLRLVDLLKADPVAEIDPEPFYLYNLPGPMDVVKMFRPHIEVEEGLIKSLEMPTNTFYCHEAGNLTLFVGKEPNISWRTFAEAIFDFAREVGTRRIFLLVPLGGRCRTRVSPVCMLPAVIPNCLRRWRSTVYGGAATKAPGPSRAI